MTVPVAAAGGGAGVGAASGGAGAAGGAGGGKELWNKLNDPKANAQTMQGMGAIQKAGGQSNIDALVGSNAKGSEGLTQDQVAGIRDLGSSVANPKSSDSAKATEEANKGTMA